MKPPNKIQVLAIVAIFVLGLSCGYYTHSYLSAYQRYGGDVRQHEFLEACRNGDIRSMERLNRSGANPSRYAIGDFGESGPPILAAAENGQADAVQWLLDRGAKWDVFVSDGCTPLGAAESKKRDSERTIEILRAAKARHKNVTPSEQAAPSNP